MPNTIKYPLLFLFFFTLLPKPLAQSNSKPGVRLLSFDLPDTVYKKRFWMAAGAGAVGYSVAMTSLYKAWYANYPLTKFHTFNDIREWQQMDKAGHCLMSYQENKWGFEMARWVGFDEKRSSWLGFATGQFVQGSIETFDGFSAQWGFSVGDICANLLGTTLFTTQQLMWKEQRICLKMSATHPDFPDDRIYPISPANDPRYTTLDARSKQLYGKGIGSLFLKNYNARTIWASVSPASFSGKARTWWPKWLNLAVGMGAENMFAGFGYSWNDPKGCSGGDCLTYAVDPLLFPRKRQLFLSLDLDLSKIPVKSRFLKYLLIGANMIKIPAPSLEWRSGGDWYFHPFYF